MWRCPTSTVRVSRAPPRLFPLGDQFQRFARTLYQSVFVEIQGYVEVADFQLVHEIFVWIQALQVSDAEILEGVLPEHDIFSLLPDLFAV